LPTRFHPASRLHARARARRPPWPFHTHEFGVLPSADSCAPAGPPLHRTVAFHLDEILQPSSMPCCSASESRRASARSCTLATSSLCPRARPAARPHVRGSTSTHRGARFGYLRCPALHRQPPRLLSAPQSTRPQRRRQHRQANAFPLPLASVTCKPAPSADPRRSAAFSTPRACLSAASVLGLSSSAMAVAPL
jgi:hypothetical protein